MNEFEKKIRNKLLMRGFANDKLLNNRGLIAATIDEVILEVVKNIGVTRCSLELKEKEVMSFKDFVDTFIKVTINCETYFYKDDTFNKIQKVKDIYIKEILNL